MGDGNDVIATEGSAFHRVTKTARTQEEQLSGRV